MKKRIMAFASLLLVATMLLPLLSSCKEQGDVETAESELYESESENNVTDDSDSSGKEDLSETESGTEDTDREEPQISGENSGLIMMANGLANGVQAFFTDGNRTHYSIMNKEMTVTYARASGEKQQVASLVNSKGAVYVSNTMDIFVQMKTGETYYASDSAANTAVNLQRFGYYYYEGLFEGQNFIPEGYNILKSISMDVSAYSEDHFNNMSVSYSEEDGASFVIENANDPYFVYGGLDVSSTKCNVLKITAKSVGNTTGCQIYMLLNNESATAERRTSFTVTPDGEYHTYYVVLDEFDWYKGRITGLRLDPNGNVGDGIIIKDIQFGQAKLDAFPRYVSISRHFHVYSDKMHHAVQFATTKLSKDIASVGMVTEIDASTVSSLIVKDAAGEHDSLDSVDWSSVECIGFDIRGAGVFGYILPNDVIGGEITVTLEDGTYRIVQSRTPENMTLNPSEKGSNNSNDFYLGQRIYTDESHSFEGLLWETSLEREPLSDKRISVSASNSDNGSFIGYDAMRGIYVLGIASPSGGFYGPYNNPNRNYKVNFNIRSDVDRDIYLMTCSELGLLECAALLDENMMMLPVPVEVIKNFSDTVGRTLYDIDDADFSEAIFPLSLKAGEKYGYSILNLYQNWGNYPLKQLSQIPYYCPYYHLSTGVTETNCIVPWFHTESVGKGALNTLPDFRPMSAPFIHGQPQHHNSGAHAWLEYFDESGNRIAVENVKNTITSYGPTYAEVIMENISDDGKIKVTYTHMEMPQTDENRTYYTMEYEVLEDISFGDFKNQFKLYDMTDNDDTGVYQRVGYLDSDNVSRVVAANKDAGVIEEYVLGKSCPYFTFFEMPGKYDKKTNPEGYSSGGGYGNLAFLIYNSAFVIGGKAAEPDFVVLNSNGHLSLTLDIKEITFKAGDRFAVNAILLPWGSQELNDGIIDAEKGNYEYTMPLSDGSLYMDKNVRDVRENTLLNPLKVTSETDEIIDSVYLPKIRSKDGRTAEFTLLGGENNVAVRIYGFNMLTNPVVEEYVDGEWKAYELNSANNPDRLGFYHYYDGYGVQYDGDGTYSYSFVTTMTDGKPRKFRVSADEAFAGWPAEKLPEGNEDLLDVYIDPEEMKSEIDVTSHMFGEARMNDGYVSIFVKLDNDKYKESYAQFYYVDDGAALEDCVSGQYFVIKYRVPKEFSSDIGAMSVWSKTTNYIEKTTSDYFNFNPICDGEWHVEVYDLASLIPNYFLDEAGAYHAKYLRLDIFNKTFTDPNVYVDIAYFGIDDDLAAIGELCRDEFDIIPLYSKGETGSVDTSTGKLISNSLIDPDSGYTKSDAAFGSNLGYIGGVKQDNFISHTKNGGNQFYFGATVDEYCKLYLRGWCTVDGGVEKYVWSVDGKVWHDVGDAENVTTAVSSVYAETGQIYAGKTFGDFNGSFKNALFTANKGVSIDLSAYAGQTVDVIFAAVPTKDTSTLVLLYNLKSVTCTVTEVKEIPAFGANMGTISGVSQNNFISHTKNGGNVHYSGATVDEEYKIYLRGWCTVDGGVERYVWTVDGENWYDVEDTENIATAVNTVYAETGQTYSGKTFKDFEGSFTNALFTANKGISINLADYVGRTVDVIFAAVPVTDPEIKVLLYTLDGVECIYNEDDNKTESETENEQIPTECEHTRVGEWYYYDDGNSDTYSALEACDCLDCSEGAVAVRGATFRGYFNEISGNGKTSAATGTTDLSAKGVSASDSGTLTLKYWMGLISGTFNTALYMVTDEGGNSSEWITFASRGQGIGGVDQNTKDAVTASGFDGNNTGFINTSIDLGAYAGQRITVTFAVIVADADGQGFTDKILTFAVLNNVVVPSAE